MGTHVFGCKRLAVNVIIIRYLDVTALAVNVMGTHVFGCKRTSCKRYYNLTLVAKVICQDEGNNKFFKKNEQIYFTIKFCIHC
jgi:hypothetical protein